MRGKRSSEVSQGADRARSSSALLPNAEQRASCDFYRGSERSSGGVTRRDGETVRLLVLRAPLMKAWHGPEGRPRRRIDERSRLLEASRDPAPLRHHDLELVECAAGLATDE